jgi:AcrR family transcriptional regulator
MKTDPNTPKPGPTDRRIDRTRNLLADSLIDLVLEKGYEAITVQDIIDRANVGRSTFYAHFENKEQLLFSGRSWLRDDLFDEAGAATDQLTLGVNLRALFRHAANNHRLAKAMLGKNGGNLIINHIREMLALKIRKALVVQENPLDDVRAGLAADGLAALLVGLLRSWLEADLPILPDELATLAGKMMMGDNVV